MNQQRADGCIEQKKKLEKFGANQKFIILLFIWMVVVCSVGAITFWLFVFSLSHSLSIIEKRLHQYYIGNYIIWNKHTHARTLSHQKLSTSNEILSSIFQLTDRSGNNLPPIQTRLLHTFKIYTEIKHSRLRFQFLTSFFFHFFFFKSQTNLRSRKSNTSVI